MSSRSRYYQHNFQYRRDEYAKQYYGYQRNSPKRSYRSLSKLAPKKRRSSTESSKLYDVPETKKFQKECSNETRQVIMKRDNDAHHPRDTSRKHCNSFTSKTCEATKINYPNESIRIVVPSDALNKNQKFTEPIISNDSRKSHDPSTSKQSPNKSHTTNFTMPTVSEFLSSIWNNILMSGLDEEMKKVLLKKYPLPSHCEYIKIIELNTKIKHMSKASLECDCLNYACQVQLVAGITAIKETLSTALNVDSKKNVSDAKDLIVEKLIDSTLLLNNLFYDLTTVTCPCAESRYDDEKNSVPENCSNDTFVTTKYRKTEENPIYTTTSLRSKESLKSLPLTRAKNYKANLFGIRSYQQLQSFHKLPVE